ncbi:hypothetical protein Btru_030375, partial [Bulinus truncatus]
VKRSSMLANAFYEMLNSKMSRDLEPHQAESPDYDSSYESSKRSKSSRWTGSVT